MIFGLSVNENLGLRALLSDVETDNENDCNSYVTKSGSRPTNNSFVPTT